MILQALLVSQDDATAETLIHVMAQFGVAVARSNVADVAASRLAAEHFDQVVVDFDDAAAASAVLEECQRLTGPERVPVITLALLGDSSQIRSILGAGAHFVLSKPLSAKQAENTLRVATALLKRERRQSLRVAVQAPVSISLEEGDPIEGILLDLSTGGMDVLAAKPLPLAAKVRVSFELPEGIALQSSAEIAWSTANGQSGLRFAGMDSAIYEELCAWLGSHSQDVASETREVASQCKLTDLSLGGCYVETESPFPQSSTVDLCLRAEGMEIHTEGLVRVMHPGHGMGVEFPARTEAQRQSVGDFIEFLTSRPGATPQLEASPRSLVANAFDLADQASSETDPEDPLLELLRTGNDLEEDAFLAELRRQRTPEAAEVDQ